MTTPAVPAVKSSQRWGAGGVFTAGVLLLLSGGWQVLIAISALANDQLYVIGGQYIWKFDLTIWGWIQLLIGVALIVVGIFVLRGAGWAAVVAAVLATVSALLNFMWLPYQPVWAALVIALDVFIIWALGGHRDDIHLLDT